MDMKPEIKIVYQIYVVSQDGLMKTPADGYDSLTCEFTSNEEAAAAILKSTFGQGDFLVLPVVCKRLTF